MTYQVGDKIVTNDLWAAGLDPLSEAFAVKAGEQGTVVRAEINDMLRFSTDEHPVDSFGDAWVAFAAEVDLA